MEVLEGEVTFNGTKYKLERGDVTFANPAKTQPIIDLQATTRVRDYDITVQFRGDASVPNGLKVTWQSEPQLPEADVIALLALGRTQEESACRRPRAEPLDSAEKPPTCSSIKLSTAPSIAACSACSEPAASRSIPRDWPAKPPWFEGRRSPSSSRWPAISPLTYSTNVSVSNQQIIQVEYNITRTISIVALRDWNGVVSFDFKMRRRKK